MATISVIKMKFVVIKAKIFALPNRRESYYKTIEELAFNSVFEEDIYIVLKNKWANHSWVFGITAAILGIIYYIKEILS